MNLYLMAFPELAHIAVKNKMKAISQPEVILIFKGLKNIFKHKKKKEKPFRKEASNVCKFG